jgi:ATP-dependent DNA helicase RecG
MANAQGGMIIIGVEDATLEIVGISSERLAGTLDTILRASRQVSPPLLLEPADPEVYDLDGKKIVVATVPPSRGPVYQASGVFWMRRSTQTIPLTFAEMMEIANDRGLQDWELQPARNATMDDIDLAQVEQYLQLRSARTHQQSRFEPIEQVLAGMECAVEREGKLVPSNVGILFFGKHPQRHIIQSEIVCVQFRDTIGVGGYADRKIVTGTIQQQIDEAEQFLSQHIPVGARIEGWKRVDLPDYPIEALREAIVNAVVHRDYTRRGESIRVFYYSDRVEIHSPGLLLPGITVEQMSSGDVTSKLRNPVLAGILRDLPGYMERMGSGIRLMLHETAQMGLPPPLFREHQEVVVTFARAARAGEAIFLPTQEGTLWEEDQAKDQSASTQAETGLKGQEERFRQAIQYVQEHGSITNGQYRQLTGASEATALRDLEALVEQGALRITGKTRGRHYRLP